MLNRYLLLIISFVIIYGYNADPLMAGDQNAAAKRPGWEEVPFIEKNPEPELTAEERERGFLLFTRPITEIVYPNTRPLPEERFECLSAFATPGEFEPVTFALYPIQNLQGIKIVASDLQSDAGKIPSTNVDIRLVTYYDIRFPNYNSPNTYRRIPELLEKVKLNRCIERECQRYWVIIKIPKNAKPGLYQGMLSLACNRTKKPITIPVKMRVLAFKLKKDPTKQFTAFNYDVSWRKDYGTKYNTDEHELRRIARNEYRAMLDYGFTMPSTFYLLYDEAHDRFYMRHPEALKLMAKAGLKGSFVFIVMDAAIQRLYKKFTGKDAPSLYRVPAMPAEEFYNKITQLTKGIDSELKSSQWPECFYLPLDEVHPDAVEFGTSVYSAVSKAGVKIWITTRPNKPYAQQYAKYVDKWFCTIEYLVPYETAAAFNKRYEYWCYPNNQTCQVRIPEVQCKGGRMTWGFGFWRSGFTGLMPWIWRWDLEDPFNYLDYKVSDCGFKIARDGSMIPTTYWECIREGIDDGRYIYTLQQAIAEREDAQDPECRKLVAEAKRLIQSIWDSIKVQSVYMSGGIWDSKEFNAIRWSMADLSDKLNKYEKVRKVTAPSVLIE
jgi:hypothetical protein